VKHYSWPLATTIRFRRNAIRKWTPSLVDAFTWEFKVVLTGNRSFLPWGGGETAPIRRKHDGTRLFYCQGPNFIFSLEIPRLVKSLQCCVK
jgi:hypothetical protein